LHHLKLFHFFQEWKVFKIVLKVTESPCISFASYKFEISAFISLQEKWLGMLGGKRNKIELSLQWRGFVGFLFCFFSNILNFLASISHTCANSVNNSVGCQQSVEVACLFSEL